MIELTTFHPVESLHQQGVSLAAGGCVNKAAILYAHASELAGIIDDPTDLNASQRLHQARIARDQAFLGVYAYDPFDPGKLDADGLIENQLKAVKMRTESLLDVGKRNFTESSWARLNSEHGATIGLQARLLVRKAIEGSARLDEAADVFQEAESFLSNGNISYYGASNAIRAAGAERLRGRRRLSCMRWVGRSLIYPTVAHTPADAIASTRTIFVNAMRLPSVQAIISGIENRP